MEKVAIYRYDDFNVSGSKQRLIDLPDKNYKQRGTSGYVGVNAYVWSASNYGYYSSFYNGIKTLRSPTRTVDKTVSSQKKMFINACIDSDQQRGLPLESKEFYLRHYVQINWKEKVNKYQRNYAAKAKQNVNKIKPIKKMIIPAFNDHFKEFGCFNIKYYRNSFTIAIHYLSYEMTARIKNEASKHTVKCKKLGVDVVYECKSHQRIVVKVKKLMRDSLYMQI